jgi:hypothetical protein
MELLAVLTEQVQAMSDGLARATEDPRRLAMGDLGDEGAHETLVEPRLLEAEVDAEGLSGKGAPALEAQEALHVPAVAGAKEVTLEAPAVMTAAERGAVGTRAAIGQEAHRRSFLPGRARE